MRSDARQTYLATILGYGESSDSHHITQPHPQGHGAAKAIAQAMANAGLVPKDIDLISAHATATPDNDAAEYAAFSNVFQDQLSATPVVAFKGHLGHTLGGAGAVELILAAMAMHAHLVPPIPQVRDGQVEFPHLRLVTGDQAQRSQIDVTLNTSLGFGGANTCMILGHPSTEMARADCPQPTPRHTTVAGNEALITGIGVVAPGCIGNEAYMHRLEGASGSGVDRDSGAISDEALVELINARRSRRMSQLVKLTLGATTVAYQDAGIDPLSDWSESCSGILGTMHGSINYCERYYRQVVEEGVNAANPMLFAEGVPNAPSAHLSLAMGIKGSCQTIIGSRTAGLDAMSLAVMRIASGEWDRAIVGAVDEYSHVVERAYRHFGWGTPCDGAEDGPFFGEGAVILILESAALANRRGARPYGRVQGTACASGLGSVTGQALVQAGRSLERLGQPRFVIGSAPGTGLGRLELASLLAGRKQAPAPSSPLVWSSIYSHVAEMFSVGPLAAIAAVLLTGRMPKLLGHTPQTHGTVEPATGNEQAGIFAVLCGDHTGTVSGVCAARTSDRRLPTQR